MTGKWKVGVLCLTLALSAAAAWKLTAGDPSFEKQRETLTKNHKDGNFKDAYEGLRKLALDPKDDPLKVGADLDLAIDCLIRLGRVDEIDDFREAVIKVHDKNWRLLQTAANGYVANPNRRNNLHYGYIVVNPDGRPKSRFRSAVRFPSALPLRCGS